MNKLLQKKYGIKWHDGLVSDIYGYFHRRGGFFRIATLAVQVAFRYRVKKYKNGAPFDFGPMERYFCESNYGFSVGKYSYGILQFCFNTINIGSIGAFCSFAPGIVITGQNHPLNKITTHPILYSSDSGSFIPDHREHLLDGSKNEKVVIGNDVWIGQNVTILPSVKIGNGAIVGAGAVVTKHVADYAIVAGNPAKLIRYRFSPDQIEMLNKIRWWDWEDALIRQHIEKFTNPNQFLQEFGLCE